MAHQTHNNLPEEVVELLTKQDPTGVRQALEVLLNATMRVFRRK